VQGSTICLTVYGSGLIVQWDNATSWLRREEDRARSFPLLQEPLFLHTPTKMWETREPMWKGREYLAITLAWTRVTFTVHQPLCQSRQNSVPPFNWKHIQKAFSFWVEAEHGGECLCKHAHSWVSETNLW